MTHRVSFMNAQPPRSSTYAQQRPDGVGGVGVRRDVSRAGNGLLLPVNRVHAPRCSTMEVIAARDARVWGRKRDAGSVILRFSTAPGDARSESADSARRNRRATLSITATIMNVPAECFPRFPSVARPKRSNSDASSPVLFERECGTAKRDRGSAASWTMARRSDSAPRPRAVRPCAKGGS